MTKPPFESGPQPAPHTEQLLPNAAIPLGVDVPNAVAYRLTGDSGYGIIPRDSFSPHVDDHTSEKYGHVEQELVGFMRVGIEESNNAVMLSLLKTNINGTKMLVLAKVPQKGELDYSGRPKVKAEVVGILSPEEDFAFGRSKLDAYNETISRQQGSVFYNPNGSIIIRNKSVNGTDVVIFEEPKTKTEEHVAKGGLRGIVGRKRRNQAARTTDDVGAHVHNTDVRDGTLHVDDIMNDGEGRWAVETAILLNMARFKYDDLSPTHTAVADDNMKRGWGVTETAQSDPQVVFSGTDRRQLWANEYSGDVNETITPRGTPGAAPESVTPTDSAAVRDAVDVVFAQMDTLVMTPETLNEVTMQLRKKISERLASGDSHEQRGWGAYSVSDALFYYVKELESAEIGATDGNGVSQLYAQGNNLRQLLLKAGVTERELQTLAYLTHVKKVNTKRDT